MELEFAIYVAFISASASLLVLLKAFHIFREQKRHI